MTAIHFTHYIGKGIALLLLGMASHQAGAHGGGLNSEGCHNNRKTGDYHCHRGAPQKARASSAPLAARDDVNRTLPVATAGMRPQCFTGPRGGTYTITASGRKNYSGC